MNGKDLKPEKAIIIINTPSSIDALYKLYKFWGFSVNSATVNRYMRKEDILRLVCVNGKRIV